MKLRLNHPEIQNLVASLIVGLGPGVYVALTVLGAGGGPANATNMQNIANSTLYAVFFVTGLFSGSVVTTIGPKYTFMIGAFGYPLYAGSLWYFTNTARLWFPVFGGAFLGFTASLLWTAAAFIAFSYPVEGQKGRFISEQWGLVSLGSTLASLVGFSINFNASELQVPIAVYIVFIILMACGFFVALLLIIPPQKVHRSDGAALAHYHHQGFWYELQGQSQLLKDWRMLALIIPMFGSEIAIIIFSTLNGLFFNIRTRSLNSVMFTLMQAIGAIVITLPLDNKLIGSRRTRGMVSIAVMGTTTVAMWIGLCVWVERNAPAASDPLNPPLWDWTDSEFGGFLVLTLILGFNMVTYQVVVQWIISALTNDPKQLARFAGFAKGCLAGGLCVSFGVEAAGILQIYNVAFQFTLQGVGLVCMTIVCWTAVKPTNYGIDENVIPPAGVDKEGQVEATSSEKR